MNFNIYTLCPWNRHLTLGEGVHHWLNPPTQTKDQFHSCCKIHSSKFENKIKSSWSILSKNWKCLDSFKEIHYAYDTSQYISSNEKHYLRLVESHSHWFALIPPLMLKKHTVCTGLTNEMLKLNSDALNFLLYKHKNTIKNAINKHGHMQKNLLQNNHSPAAGHFYTQTTYNATLNIRFLNDNRTIKIKIHSCLLPRIKCQITFTINYSFTADPFTRT